ncbi:NAD(P)/FAD-dependent oxidoreductase [Psychrobacter sp. ANT_WB68]|uniref:NAD(P)/FAD-dependent oxidoreductase n=1 Tax=Psychrobacter sp. ANT_WB68 TaxID=2597355 RepID=UPI0011F0A763|nr:NAD(P)-binding protein [Psychrobacter sp. ANT_WB68]KAA0913605.1 NADP transhydrogenase subunit alpha [Psychrobacter sp. ANT_WB68]
MPDSSLQPTQTSSPKIAIIGGGLTGLFTATLLERAFSQINDKQNDNKSLLPQITIFEKSRSVGRLATRYRTDSHTNKNWQWAFGAQFFTAKSASFQQFIKPWLKTDLLQPWCAQVVNLIPINANNQTPDIQPKEQWSSIQARYISTPKMTSWGRALADELQHTTINFKTRVAPLAQYNQTLANKASRKTNKKTELFDEEGNSLGSFDWVICTAPNAQAVELMADRGFAEQTKITESQMQACYTLMLGWDDKQPLPEALSCQEMAWDVAYVQNSILDRIFIEHQKPAHNELLPSITIDARNDWSEQHVDADIDTVKAQLLVAAKQALGWNADSMPSQVDCHRWRYAATITNANKDELGVLVDNEKQWIVSGDWCGQGNIESCYQMATQAVARICAHSLISAD